MQSDMIEYSQNSLFASMLETDGIATKKSQRKFIPRPLIAIVWNSSAIYIIETELKDIFPFLLL